MVQKDTYNWKGLNENYQKERIKFERRGLQKLADIMKSYSEYLINDVYMAITLIDKNFDFNETDITRVINWVKLISPKLGEDLDESYLDSMISSGHEEKISLVVFREKFQMKIPTSEAAVERVFSEHKRFHTN